MKAIRGENCPDFRSLKGIGRLYRGRMQNAYTHNPRRVPLMRAVKLLALTTIVAIMICGGCARESEISAPREWAFEMEKVWEIQQIGEDELLRPAEPRVADDGTLYFHDFERHLSYIIDGDGKPVSTFAPRGSD